MYNVNNKKCVKNIAYKSLKVNKTRNIVSIIAIVITTLLFTSVFTVLSVIVHSYEQSSFKQAGGYAHGTLKDISKDSVQSLKNHNLIEKYGIVRNIGIIEDGVFAKTPVEINYIDKNASKLRYIDFIEGSLPKENSMEIACDTNILKILKIPKKIGEKIELTYKISTEKTVTDTFILSGYFETNSSAIMDRSYVYVPNSYIDDVMLKNAKYIKKTDKIGNVSMDILLKSDNNIEKNILKIINDSGFQTNDENKDNYIKYGINWGYLSAQITEIIDIGSTLFVFILFLLFILSGYLIIYNIFNISVLNDIKFYGLLKTIGTTNRQIKKIMYHQVFFLH